MKAFNRTVDKTKKLRSPGYCYKYDFYDWAIGDCRTYYHIEDFELACNAARQLQLKYPKRFRFTQRKKRGDLGGTLWRIKPKKQKKTLDNHS